MYDRTPEYHTPRRPRRRALPILLFGAVAVVTIASVAFTVLWGHKLPANTTAAVSVVTPAVPSNVPTPSASAPPLGTRFVVPDDTTGATPTPCPTYTLPVQVIGTPPPSTPSADSTATITATATVTSIGTVTATSTIPTCGDGKLFGPHQVCTNFPGTEPTQDQIRQSLFASAGQTQFSFPLVEAIAWQESGWRELIQACDGGIGVMQIQPETVTWLNQTFGTTYDAKVLDGNTHLGTSMLSWLYNYYLPFCTKGLPAGQTCTGDTIWPGATDGATMRDIVISAYNEGPGTMAKYGIQNWNYVNSVKAFLTQFKASA